MYTPLTQSYTYTQRMCERKRDRNKNIFLDTYATEMNIGWWVCIVSHSCFVPYFDCNSDSVYRL